MNPQRSGPSKVEKGMVEVEGGNIELEHNSMNAGRAPIITKTRKRKTDKKLEEN